MAVIHRPLLWPIQKTAAGETAANSSRAATRFLQFLKRKWAKELDYRLIKEVWAYTDNRIAVRFQYEWHDESRDFFRSHGNENWEFSETGLMQRREASINDVPIQESDRLFTWGDGPRPENFPGLTELGL